MPYALKAIKALAAMVITTAVAFSMLLVSTPEASASSQWPTHTRVVTNSSDFKNGKTPFYEIKVHATDGPGRSLRGRATLYVNGNAQRIRDLEYGWRSFRIDRKDLPNDRNARVQVRVNPRGNDHRTVTVTRWVRDVTITPGQKVVKVAKAQVGERYVYGADGPSSFDCSGLVQYAYKKAVGKNLPHSSSAIKEKGRRVARGDARPGDLLWTPGHIAIYAGGGKVVEAATPRTGVVYRQIWQKNPQFIRV